jgi:hypothetical protein
MAIRVDKSLVYILSLKSNFTDTEYTGFPLGSTATQLFFMSYTSVSDPLTSSNSKLMHSKQGKHFTACTVS